MDELYVFAFQVILVLHTWTRILLNRETKNLFPTTFQILIILLNLKTNDARDRRFGSFKLFDYIIY